MPNTLKGLILWEIFQHPKSENCNKIEGDPLGFYSRKKSGSATKNERGPFSLVRYCMLRGKLFWFSSLGQRIQFGVFLNFVELLVELFWSLQVYRKKLTKSHDYSRLFSQEKRRL